MSITKMIEYQKIDKDLYYMEKEFANSPEIQRYSLIQTTYKEKIDQIPKLNKELEDIVLQLNELVERMDALDKEKSALDADVESYTAAEQFAQYEEKLTALENEINAAARESSRLYKKITDIGSENKRILDQVDSLQAQGNKVKRDFLDKQQTMRLKASPIVEKLKAIIPSISPELLKRYMASREAKRFPVFVPYTDEGNCAGCGMFVKIEVDKHLINPDDVAECPHCRRVLYKK